MWDEHFFKQSLSPLAEDLKQIESEEEVQSALQATVMSQRRADIFREIQRILQIACFIANLPSEDVWTKVKKTPDLEIFFHYSRWTYKRIGQAFAAEALESMGSSISKLDSSEAIEDDELVNMFQLLEAVTSDTNFFHLDKKVLKNAAKSDFLLIRKKAEVCFREWIVIDAVFPELSRRRFADLDSFQNAEDFFCVTISREAENPVLKRGQSHFEFQPKKEMRLLQNVDKLCADKPSQKKRERLFRKPELYQNLTRDQVILAAIQLAENDGCLARKINFLDIAIKDLRDEAIRDLDRDRSSGHKYKHQVWEHGIRSTFPNNRKTKTPYPATPTEVELSFDL